DRGRTGSATVPPRADAGRRLRGASLSKSPGAACARGRGDRLGGARPRRASGAALHALLQRPTVRRFVAVLAGRGRSCERAIRERERSVVLPASPLVGQTDRRGGKRARFGTRGARRRAVADRW